MATFSRRKNYWVKVFRIVGQNEKLFSFNMSEMPAYEVIRR